LAASARRTFHDALDQVEGIATESTEVAAATLRKTTYSAGDRPPSVFRTTSGPRDSLLLGLAAVAVAAAAGIALQKRITTEV